MKGFINTVVLATMAAGAAALPSTSQGWRRGEGSGSSAVSQAVQQVGSIIRSPHPLNRRYSDLASGSSSSYDEDFAFPDENGEYPDPGEGYEWVDEDMADVLDARADVCDPVATTTTSTRTSTSTSTVHTTTTTLTTKTSTATSTALRTTTTATTSWTTTTARQTATTTTTSAATAKTTSSSSSSSTSASTSPSPSPSPYVLQRRYSGANFFQQMSFFTASDPTNGMVDYVNSTEAVSNGLVGTNPDGSVFIKYSNVTNVDGTRQSVRVNTKDSFTGGVFVLDYNHVPTGCGVWPAWWTVPARAGWPSGGEIDIIEGVHYSRSNMQSVHTVPGCTIAAQQNMLGKLAYYDTAKANNCASAETNNQGCGIVSQTRDDYGSGVNLAGGGTHVMVWDDDRIAVYFFAKGNVPSDITSGTPDPTSSAWGLPRGLWPATSCSPLTDFFNNHVAVFSNTICGDWAGSDAIWNAPSNNGQEFSCAAKTGTKTCQEYMLSGKADMSTAYWSINSMSIYQKTRRA